MNVAPNKIGEDTWSGISIGFCPHSAGRTTFPWHTSEGTKIFWKTNVSSDGILGSQFSRTRPKRIIHYARFPIYDSQRKGIDLFPDG